MRGEVRQRQASCARDFLLVVHLADFGVALTHLSKRSVRVYLATKAYRNLADVQVEPDFVATAKPMQVIGSAERRMSGKRQFLTYGEDAHASAVAPILLRFAGQDECRLRQVHLPRHGLHLLVSQPPRIGEDCQLIALKRPLGKYVQKHVRILARLSRWHLSMLQGNTRRGCRGCDADSGKSRSTAAISGYVKRLTAD